MITSINKAIPITLAKVDKRTLNKQVVFNAETSELKFKVNTAAGKNFRLVHDGKNVLTVIDGGDLDTTGTIHTILEFKTLEAVTTEIKKLGLINYESWQWEIL